MKEGSKKEEKGESKKKEAAEVKAGTDHKKPNFAATKKKAMAMMMKNADKKMKSDGEMY